MAIKDFKGAENALDIKKILNNTGKGFCLAKWFNATIWLGNGMTTSCHHPPSHQIPLEEVEKDFRAIHNTEYKKSVRKEMLEGKRPEECDYCWKIEGLGDNYVSDRSYKSMIFTDKEIEKAKELSYTDNAIPKTLEIAFDANCNFACSYCNPTFSTTWMTDIKVNGPYKDLISDGGAAFEQDGKWAIPYGKNNENNPYVQAFMEWWEKELQYELNELRVTGGEATMSNDFWKLVDWWKDNKDCDVQFAVNSNLGVNKKLIAKLTDATHSFKNFVMYTSNEANGKHSEYIRDGIDYSQWLENIEYMLEHGNIKEFNVMMTINALCLFSLTEFMEDMLIFRKQYGKEFMSMSFNILRFPSFQSVTTLPKEVRLERSNHLEQWMKTRIDLNDQESEGLVRTISYLREIDEGHDYVSSLKTRERDFKTFYSEYDRRRNKNFVETFPELKEWFESIRKPTVIPITEASKLSREEKWQKFKQASNPGSKDFKK